MRLIVFVDLLCNCSPTGRSFGDMLPQSGEGSPRTCLSCSAVGFLASLTLSRAMKRAPRQIRSRFKLNGAAANTKRTATSVERNTDHQLGNEIRTSGRLVATSLKGAFCGALVGNCMPLCRALGALRKPTIPEIFANRVPRGTKSA